LISSILGVARVSAHKPQLLYKAPTAEFNTSTRGQHSSLSNTVTQTEMLSPFPGIWIVGFAYMVKVITDVAVPIALG